MTRYPIAKSNYKAVAYISGVLSFVWFLLVITSPYLNWVGKIIEMLGVILLTAWPMLTFPFLYITINSSEITLPGIKRRRIAIDKIERLNFKERGAWDGVEIEHQTASGLKKDTGPGFGLFNKSDIQKMVDQLISVNPHIKIDPVVSKLLEVHKKPARKFNLKNKQFVGWSGASMSVAIFFSGLFTEKYIQEFYPWLGVIFPIAIASMIFFMGYAFGGLKGGLTILGAAIGLLLVVLGLSHFGLSVPSGAFTIAIVYIALYYYKKQQRQS